MSSTRSRQRLLRVNRLGSEAVYRVIGEKSGIVTTEVVQAPGLARGTRVRLTEHAVRAIGRLDRAGSRPAAARHRFGLRLGHI